MAVNRRLHYYWFFGCKLLIYMAQTALKFRPVNCSIVCTPAVAGNQSGGGNTVQTLLLKLQFKIEELANREEGQDMVEYALVVGLICFGAASASQFLAAGLATTFSNLNTSLGSYVS